MLDKLGIRICHGDLWFVADRGDPTVGRPVHHIMKTADMRGRASSEGAAQSVAGRLLSNPWRVSAPWKSWPARSQSPEDLHWKEKVDACADKARQEVMDHLVSLCGDYLRVSVVMSLQSSKATPPAAELTAQNPGLRTQHALEMHQVDLMGKFQGMVHARAHVEKLLKSCQSKGGKAELVRQCVYPPSPELLGRLHGIDHIKVSDVAGRLIDVCIVWSAGQHAWSGESSSSTRHIALAGELLSYASMLPGTPEQGMQEHVRKASGQLDLIGMVATLVGDEALNER